MYTKKKKKWKREKRRDMREKERKKNDLSHSIFYLYERGDVLGEYAFLIFLHSFFLPFPHSSIPPFPVLSFFHSFIPFFTLSYAYFIPGVRSSFIFNFRDYSFISSFIQFPSCFNLYLIYLIPSVLSPPSFLCIQLSIFFFFLFLRLVFSSFCNFFLPFFFFLVFFLLVFTSAPTTLPLQQSQ